MKYSTTSSGIELSAGSPTGAGGVGKVIGCGGISIPELAGRLEGTGVTEIRKKLDIVCSKKGFTSRKFFWASRTKGSN